MTQEIFNSSMTGKRSLPPGYFDLSMRRYLGCKTRLLNEIEQVVQENCPNISTFMDIFAGTGVVADRFNSSERKIIVNDFLISNATVLEAWFLAQESDREEIESTVAYLRSLKPRKGTYYGRNYGDRFFTMETADLIGTIRDAIDELNLRPVVKSAAIASLLYAADASALTCGHFDAWRGLKDRARPFELRIPAIPYGSNGNNEVYCCDGNELARKVEVELLYIDPPYNRRQYSTLYHVHETITRNDKPRLIGKTRKPPLKNRPKSKYSSAEASEAFKDLVLNCRARYLLVSYNNMRRGGSNSNAIMDRKTIEEILSLRGRVRTYCFDFPSFTARRGLLPGHQEYLFFCRVTKKPSTATCSVSLKAGQFRKIGP